MHLRFGDYRRGVASAAASVNHGGMDVTEWLLDSDPSIRWQVMRDLTDASPDAVAAERSRVATDGWGAQLLALQDDRGYWGGHEYGRDRDRRSVQWTLQSLRRFGIDPAQPETRRAIERVRDGVTWSEFDDLPYFHGEVEPCVNGGVLAAASYFGELGEGSDRIIGMLLDEQLDDGGWNCDAPESDRTSVDTTICVLEGFAEYERVIGESDPAIPDARVRAEEYLLERRLFRRKSTGELIKQRYVDFAFPPYWFYDVLRGLDYFRGVGGPPDPRLADAIELVRWQRGEDGRWPAGTPRRGEVYFALDTSPGEPSHWNTVRALQVLEWYDGSRAAP